VGAAIGKLWPFAAEEEYSLPLYYSSRSSVVRVFNLEPGEY